MVVARLSVAGVAGSGQWEVGSEKIYLLAGGGAHERNLTFTYSTAKPASFHALNPPISDETFA